jgi:anti-sigma-K factor RskA
MTDRDRLDGASEDGPDVAAAELALGVLEGEERAVALRRVLAEPDFAREVERWRAYFAGLFAGVPDVAPPAALEPRVLGRIDRPVEVPRDYWKPFAIASSLAAASLFGVLLVKPQSEPVVIAAVPVPAPMVAALMIEGRDQPMVAVYDAARSMVKMPGPMAVPDGRSAQLWAIVEGDPTPHPLGTFRLVAKQGMVASAQSTKPMAPGTTLAISIEPLGGSPTGLPTGPVVASGTLSRV